MRFLGTITVAIATLFGLELGIQARDHYPFKLPTASPGPCPYSEHRDAQLGYIPKELIVTEPSQRPELFLVGDSIVAGHGYDDLQDSLGPRLQRDLEAKGLPLTVRALGAPGYNLSQQLRLLEIELLKDRPVPPHGILLTLNAGDADAPLKLTPHCRLIDPAGSSNQKITLGSVLRLVSIRQLLIAKAVPIINRFGISAYFGPQLIAALKPRLASPRWQQAASDLERLKTRASHMQIPLLVLIFPYSAELSVPADQNPLSSFLEDFVKKAEVSSLVILDRISGLSPQEAYLEGNALHLSPVAYDRVLPDMTARVLKLK